MNIYYTNPYFTKLPYELKNHIYSYMPEHPVIKCMSEYNNIKICGKCKKYKNHFTNPYIGIYPDGNDVCLLCAETIYKNFPINIITINHINNSNLKKDDNNNIDYMLNINNSLINLNKAKILYNFIKNNKLINIKIENNDINGKKLRKDIYYIFKVFCNNSTNEFNILLNYIQNKDINTVFYNNNIIELNNIHKNIFLLHIEKLLNEEYINSPYKYYLLNKLKIELKEYYLNNNLLNICYCEYSFNNNFLLLNKTNNDIINNTNDIFNRKKIYDDLNLKHYQDIIYIIYFTSKIEIPILYYFKSFLC